MNIVAWDGNVQLHGAYACDTARPMRARSAMTGVEPRGAPYGSKASARAVSKTTNRMLGGFTFGAHSIPSVERALPGRHVFVSSS